MIHFSLFSGIGGFEIAAEAMGWKNFLSCDINEFGNRVREYYWPDAYHHKNIKDLNYETIHAELSKRFGSEWRSEDIILTGGFPCQPYSVAGKQLGTEDDRHLWPEMLRIISEVQPRWIVGENVRGLINWGGGVVFDEVQADLEAKGYEILPFLLPACAVNAPHRRDRIWFIAFNAKFSTNGRHNSGAGPGIGMEVDRDFVDQTEREQSANDIKSPSGNAPNSTKGLRTEEEQTNKFDDVADTRLFGQEISEEQTAGTKQCGQGYATDTQSERSEWPELGEQPETCKQKQGESGRSGGENVTPNTNSGRQPGKKYRKKEPGCFAKKSFSDYWENFPTQSPICSGDDELSGRLDGITFPKWRNESIKAYGNAVVPALVLQIFKAIEKYNSNNL